MALTISKVGSPDAFLLTFKPLAGSIREPFYILLDPVLEEPTTNSLLPHLHPPLYKQCTSSTRQIPTPDVIIISRSRNNHLLEATLRDLTLTTTKTIIITDQATAKTIQTWKYFDNSIVKTLLPWQDPRQIGQDRVIRLPLPPCHVGGQHGEVTVSLIPQKGIAKCARAAIGVTYRPSPSRPSPFRRSATTPVTIPIPISRFYVPPPRHLPSLAAPSLGTLTARLVPLTPPDTPNLAHFSRNHRNKTLPQPPIQDELPQRPIEAISPSPRIHCQTLSVIFSPRGTSYSSIKPYATSHLVAEAALPLTALIHNFDAEPRPRWILGRNNSHLPIGQETALSLGARVWAAASSWDDKPVMRSRGARSRTFLWHEVQEMLDRAEAREKRVSSCHDAQRSTQVLDLEQGEEVTLTSDGICEPDFASQRQSVMPDALGLFNSISVI